MAIDKSLIEDVKKHIDIVQVISAYQQVIKKGKDYVALCPFHDDSNPSMMISVSRQIFKCFVCGKGGDAIKYIMLREGINYFDALKKAAEICHYHDERLEKKTVISKEEQAKLPLYKCLNDLINYYHYCLTSEGGEHALNYLNQRQIDNKMIETYKIGYAPKDGKNTIAFLRSKGHSLETINSLELALVRNNEYIDKNMDRVIFPLCDKDGRFIGTSARTLIGDERKYINTNETPLFHKSSLLYNYHVAREKCHLDGYIYVLEGFMDVIALSRIGIVSAVALMGTALTQEHITLLRRLNVEVRLCLDGDKPGQEATFKNANLLYKAGISLRIVNHNNNPDKDCDEIFTHQGANALRNYLNNLVNRLDFVLDYYRHTNPLSNAEQKRRLVEQYTPILANLNNALDYDNYVRKLAEVTEYNVESIKSIVSMARKSRQVDKKMILHFDPQRKKLQKLEKVEREMLYQMTNNKDAIIYYEENMPSFYQDAYRNIAHYLIEYASNHDNIDVSDVVSMIESSEDDNRETLIDELTTIQFEKDHLKSCNKETYRDLLNVMNNERKKINDKTMIKEMLKNKDEMSKARILNDYNRNKNK